jgi:RecA/RadA recombinase
MLKKSVAQQVVESDEKDTSICKVSRRDLLSTGSTLLNLACSDNPFGGFLKGKYYFLVGDSTSGKTFLSMTCFAEAVKNKEFKKYRLIYDNVEDGCLMDIEGLFGKEAANQIEPPSKDKDGEPVFSFTVEEFYYHLSDAVERKEPFIYVLDSMDSLSSDYEGEKFEAHKVAHRADKATPGSYGDGKARKNSEGIRQMLKGIRETNSILIILSQTRDNLGFGFEKKTRSGGHALKFYSTVEIWSSVTGQITKTVKGKTRNIGIHSGIQIKKNRITGKRHQVEIDIYPSYGIDDVGTCIDYLTEEGWWVIKKSSIEAVEFSITATREKLIKVIEEKNLENELKSIVGKCWKSIEIASIPLRKKKY